MAQGETIIDVISDIKNIDWHQKTGLIKQPVKIEQLIFAYYEKPKREDDIDLFRHIDITDHNFNKYLENMSEEIGRGIGLTSLVKLQNPQDTPGEYNIGQTFLHIPMLDIDMDEAFSGMKETEAVSLIKNKIRKETELDKGVILKSDRGNNYHFIGLGRLFHISELETFLGLSLLINSDSLGRIRPIVDTQFVANSLTPMRNVLEPGLGASRYDISSRYSTIRINAKNNFGLSKVVDYL